MRANLEAIAGFIRRFHTEMAEAMCSGPGFIFWVFT